MKKREKPSRPGVKVLRGRVKQAAGILSGSRSLEREGARERMSGSLEIAVSRARKKVGRTIKKLGVLVEKK